MQNEKDGRQFGMDSGRELSNVALLKSDELRTLETLGATNPRATEALLNYGRQCFIGGVHMAQQSPGAGQQIADVPHVADDWIRSKFPTLTGGDGTSRYAGASSGTAPTSTR